MTASPVPDYEASWSFLTRFHPNRLVVVTGISVDKKLIPTETFAPDQHEDFLKWAEACGRSECNLYHSVGEPIARATKKLERTDVRAVHWFHVDVDPRVGEDLATEQARILALLRDPPAGLPKPTAIVFSGGGYAAFWALREPIVIDGDLARAEDAKLYNLALERALGGDHCHDVSRIMRLPGTVNLPDARKRKKGRVPTLATLVEFHDDRVYDLAQFTKAAPAASTPSVSAGAKAPAPKPAAVKLASVEALGPNVPNAVKVTIVQGGNPDDPTKWPSRSECLFWVVCELVRAGIDDATIYGVLTDPEFRISASVLEKGNGAERYALRQIERARAKALEGDDSWHEDDKGRKTPDQHNVRVYLARKGVTVAHDDFADRDEVRGLAGFGPDLSDKAINRLRLTAASEFQLFIAKDPFHDFLSDLALYNRFDPVRDYLESLSWDGAGRIDRWLVTYGGAPDSEYVRAVGALVLIAAVRRVREPGCKFDEMLVLEGSQGKNKSTALATLAVREEWFSDDLPLDADTKRLIEAIAGKWIVEAGELKGMRRGEVDSLKSALSRRVDRARMAYGRQPLELPRRCIIIGSTNSEHYLKDTTGNRRFWPVRCAQFDVDGLRHDRDQLWAEAAQREARGESIRLAPHLYPAAAHEQDARRQADPFEEVLEAHLAERTGKLRAHSVWAMLGKCDPGRRTQEDSNRTGEVMRRLGWERVKLRFGGEQPEWCYAKGSKTEREESLFVDVDPISGDVRSVGAIPDYAEVVP